MSTSSIVQDKTLSLEKPVDQLSGIGVKTAEKLSRLDIKSVRDLIFHWPRKWIDLTNPTTIKDLVGEEVAVVKGSLSDIKLEIRRGYGRNKNTIAIFSDSNNDQLPITWFNQGYLARMLKAGEEVYLRGRPRWDWRKKKLTFWNPTIYRWPGIIPIYPETEGITSRFLNRIIKETLKQLDFFDPHSIETLSECSLPSLREAVWQMHKPSSIKEALTAKKRLAVDELGCLHYLLRQQKNALEAIKAPSIKPNVVALKKLVKSLPFKLTNGQRIAAWKLIQSLKQNSPASCLLEGDVGSGKTIVAALVGVSVIKAGYNVLWMAPTQILATQLFERLQKTLDILDCKPVLVLSNFDKTQIPFQTTVFVGTHALINLKLKKKGLVIVDEQHRFGVDQRELLSRGSGKTHPHILTMTATPIPRSLALAIFDQAQLAVLTEKPVHQQPVKTKVATTRDRKEIFEIIKNETQNGRQAFIVAPRIGGSSNDEIAVKSMIKLYQRNLPGLQFGLFHGQMHEEEQSAIMKRVIGGDLDVLVATSIIEVGIDIPNATVMVIEGADRFGLAQLHQIRGRIGRGKYPGYCFVISSVDAEDTHARLKEFAKLNNGFELAELDLKLRGPGDLLGIDQSGLPPLKLADLTNIEDNQIAKSLISAWALNPPEELRGWMNLFYPNYPKHDQGKKN